MKGLFAALAGNLVFANLVMLLIFIAGGIAISLMTKENLPEISLDSISITVNYPGADPEEVEEGISRNIERSIEGLLGVKTCITYATENTGSAIIEIQDGFSTEEMLDRITTALEANADFPLGADKPILKELSNSDPVILIALQGNMDERRLKELSANVREELFAIPSITQVTCFGTRDYEISVEVSEGKLSQYNLSLFDVSEAIRRNNLNLSAGTMESKGESISLRTVGRKYTGSELADIPVTINSQEKLSKEGTENTETKTVPLSRVAQIKDDFAEEPVYAQIDGRPAVLLMIYKGNGEDSMAISRDVTAYITRKQSQLPEGASLKILNDHTKLLRDRMDLLVGNGINGLLIVFATLWIFLNGRLAFWVGMGIPFSVSGAMVILWAMGDTLNMISLFGLITVLGIIVDASIVVGEAIYVRRAAGDGPLSAAVNGVSEVAMPVVTSVLTTVIAILPLYFIKGEMGKLNAVLPVVVVSCLLVSMLECLFFLPAHLNHLPDPSQKQVSANRFLYFMQRVPEITNKMMESFIESIYIPLLHKFLQFRYILFCVSLAILMITVGILESGALKFEPLGAVEGLAMVASVEFPEGTPPHITRRALDRINAALQRMDAANKAKTGQPLLEYHFFLLGQTLEEVPKKGPNIGTVEAILKNAKHFDLQLKELMTEWEKEIGVIPGIKALTFSGMSDSPSDKPIGIWLQSKDMQKLLTASKELMARLSQLDGVFQIQSDYTPGKNEIRLKLKPEAHTLGLTVEDLARQIYAGYSGDEVVRVQRGREEVAVKIRFAAAERRNVSDLNQMRIRTFDGRQLPLRSVAEVAFAKGYSTITRVNGLRRVSVFADVNTSRANANEVYRELQENFLPDFLRKYNGLSVELQGEKSKMGESLGSLKAISPIVIAGIFVIIAAMFRSYIQPAIILLTIPFGVIGSIFGHLIMGYNLSLMSLFGMVAVAGVVVNGAILLIECVNGYLAEGIPFFGAIILGSARRFRAIFLTTVTTVCGLAPLIMETDFQAKLLIPMALSISAGEIFATSLVIFLVPCLLAILNDIRLYVRYRQTGSWVSRNAVEPATDRNREEREKAGSNKDKTIMIG